VILIDSNIFMYAAGTPHPNKEPSVTFLEQVAIGEVDALIDAEVLQEILHRYRAINRWQDGRRVYDHARQIVPYVVPITAEMLDDARALLDMYGDLTARDALHAAVYRSIEATALCSYDQDFDAIKGINRHEPPHFL
jgi:predicted nucleic acid-binding protein